ncbi:unnamed protein product [Adineta ricciae]|uniref:Uncharacterized protein n=1 Tax=Adineta ricciae TaxID=249248 RepID=A0A813S780_ADIRI|nr:unnamed protein product [Adineta ricciae]CAF1514680.1 unnamed protein product [Adineta ricciae]
MDVIVTAVGEFIWISACAIINFCLSSGVSALVVFVSFLGAILASAFYKYAISRETRLSDVALIDNNQSLPLNLLSMEDSDQTQIYIDENASDASYSNDFDFLQMCGLSNDDETVFDSL